MSTTFLAPHCLLWKGVWISVLLSGLSHDVSLSNLVISTLSSTESLNHTAASTPAKPERFPHNLGQGEEMYMSQHAT